MPVQPGEYTPFSYKVDLRLVFFFFCRINDWGKSQYVQKIIEVSFQILMNATVFDYVGFFFFL